MPKFLKNTTITPRRVGIDELIRDIAELFPRSVTQPIVRKILKAYHGRIYHHLSNGHQINIPKVCTMEPRLRHRTQIWSPQQGKYVTIEAKLQPSIRWSRDLREELEQHTEVFSDED